jgi:peptidyl-prolyl cis-trans isomerase B (cyclophilin B)
VKQLIASGFYDGTTLHRVIPHFVVQGGDPNSKNADRSDDGEGAADRTLKAEFSSKLHYRPGTVGMARDADPDSGSCQFFIALEDLPRLDGRYTIFGEVVEGLEVARRIAEVPRDLNDNPLAPMKVTIRLEKRPVREGVASLQAGEGPPGEVLTGPDKPKPFDAGNRLWQAPALLPGAPPTDFAPSGTRLELAIGPDGRVIDVRFPSLTTPEPMRLQALVRNFKFAPAQYDGRPVKARFEISLDGSGVGPPTGGGAPIDLARATGVSPPRPAVRVELPAGAKKPGRKAELRLTIDATGAVTDVALQESCGQAPLDAQAVEAARALRFEPATRAVPGKKDPEPAAVYLNLSATFVERDR